MKKKILSSLLSLALLANPSSAKCMMDNNTNSTVRTALVQQFGEDKISSYNVLLNICLQLTRSSHLCELSDLPDFNKDIQSVLDFIGKNWDKLKPHLSSVILADTDRINDKGLYNGLSIAPPLFSGPRPARLLPPRPARPVPPCLATFKTIPKCRAPQIDPQQPSENSTVLSIFCTDTLN